MSTVFEMLNQVLKVQKTIGIHEFIVVFDQALYAKACVLRMDTFQILMNHLSIVGRRFRSAGLRDKAVESG